MKTMYKKYLNGFVLTPVAVFFFCLFTPIGFVGSLIMLTIKAKILGFLSMVNNMFRGISIAIDQLAQPFVAPFFNWAMLRTREWKPGEEPPKGVNFVVIGNKVQVHKFGNVDETLSSVYGKNEALGTLTRFGQLVMVILNIIDRDHGLKSIEADENAPS